MQAPHRGASRHLTILSPEDMNNPLVDNLSVLTSLSYFSSSAFYRLLRWMDEVLSEKEITNFSDWNESLNFGAFLETLSPGLVPEISELYPPKASENICKLVKKTPDHFGVPSVLTAEEFTDPRVDELLIATYLNNFRSVRMLPISSKVTVHCRIKCTLYHGYSIRTNTLTYWCIQITSVDTCHGIVTEFHSL